MADARTRHRPLRRVLLPTDLSRGALAALARLAWLPLSESADVTVLHVLPDVRQPMAKLRQSATAEARLADTAAELERRLAAARTGDRVRIRAVLEHGLVHDRIARRAARDGAELIVMGRRGRGPFVSQPGRTAARVIREGAAPVLIVRSTPTGPFRRPLAAVDFSEASANAVRTGCRLLDPAGTALTLVHAYLTPPARALHRAGFSTAEIARYERDLGRGARNSVSKLLRQLSGLPVARLPVLVHGDPVKATLAEAVRRGADLIVLGSHGRTGLPYVLIGSVAEAVVDRARCDVLVVRPDASRARQRSSA